MYTAFHQSPMRSISIDVFAMPEVTVEGGIFACVILSVDRHSGYIMAVPGTKSKKKDKRDKHGVGLQAKTMAQAMMRHWLKVFDVPAVICSDRGAKFVGAWFGMMCKYMGVRHAKTVVYHRRPNGREEEWAGHCSKNSGNCILRSLAEIGIIPFGGFRSHTTIYRTVWFVASSHLIPAGSSCTYSPVDEPW